MRAAPKDTVQPSWPDCRPTASISRNQGPNRCWPISQPSPLSQGPSRALRVSIQETLVKDPTSPDSPRTKHRRHIQRASSYKLSPIPPALLCFISDMTTSDPQKSTRRMYISRPPAPPIPGFITIHQGACGLSSRTPGGPRLSLYC